MSEESIKMVESYYSLKKEYRDKKVSVYRDVKSRIQNNLDNSRLVNLSLNQKNIKRKIMRRYVEKHPALIDQLSPHEISRSIDRKYNRIKTCFPDQELLNDEASAVFMI